MAHVIVVIVALAVKTVQTALDAQTMLIVVDHITQLAKENVLLVIAVVIAV